MGGVRRVERGQLEPVLTPAERESVAWMRSRTHGDGLDPWCGTKNCGSTALATDATLSGVPKVVTGGVWIEATAPLR
jgi:hypothetical protein